VWDYLHQADKMLYEVKKKSKNEIDFLGVYRRKYRHRVAKKS